MTISGSEFTGASAVEFGAGNNASNLQVNAAGTQITATSPPGTGGSKVNVLVTNGVGPIRRHRCGRLHLRRCPHQWGRRRRWRRCRDAASQVAGISLGGATLKSATKAVLTVTVPGAGDLTASDAKASARLLRASASKKKKALIKKSSAHASAAGPVKLTIKLSAAGKKALKKHRKVKVKVKVSFTPSGASASAATEHDEGLDLQEEEKEEVEADPGSQISWCS